MKFSQMVLDIFLIQPHMILVLQFLKVRLITSEI